MSHTVTLTAVVGGRPNLMKMAPIVRAVEAHNRSGAWPRFQLRLVHTGLANDPRLHDTTWGDLQMPQPDVHLGVGSASSTEQTARMMIALDRFLSESPGHGVIVVGDSEAALAGALAAAKHRVPVFHVEAGLRSGDRSMPEEVNRVVTDTLAVQHFTPSPDANENLVREGVAPETVRCVGNVMIDNLFCHLQRSLQSDVLERLGLVVETVTPMGVSVVRTGMVPRFGVITLSRPENIGNPEVLGSILQTLNGVARHGPIIFPAGPATRKRIEQLDLDDYVADLSARLESFGGETAPGLPPGLYTVPSMAYLDFLRLLSKATVVITDSGGMQEETTAMGIPCITLRDETERPVTISEGTNVLVGHDRLRLRQEAVAAFSGHGKRGRIPHLWDGHASERVVKGLAAWFQEKA